MITPAIPTPEDGRGPELLAFNLLVGGGSGGGKSFPLKWAAATAALAGGPDNTTSVSAARLEED